MKKESFNTGWTVAKKTGGTGLESALGTREVTLPWDAMLTEKRSPDAPYASGSYPIGKWEYKKKFDAPVEWSEQKIYLNFDGVYENALVSLNGENLICHGYGYTPFTLDLTPSLRFGAPNELKVQVFLADGARWYSGAGIYRDVTLLRGRAVHILPAGVKVSTPQVSAPLAEVLTRVRLKNTSSFARKTVRLSAEILDENGGTVAASTVPVTLPQGETITAEIRNYIDEPRLWSPDSPALYTCRVTMLEITGDPTRPESLRTEIWDTAEEQFGVRQFTLDPKNGLRLNGEPIKLAGAGLHHENQVVGAVSTYDVEERRISRLKAAGFNAIRTAHNPPSTAFLEVCDRLGMLVMLELFDTWTNSKVNFDNTLRFQQTWEADCEAVVNMAFNHPSVLMYSIGNEIADTGNNAGALLGRKITQHMRRLDPTRYLTSGINGMVSVMGIIEQMYADSQAQVQSEGQDAINGMMSSLADTMKQIMALDVVGWLTEEICSQLDICGYNYMDIRYEKDHESYPNRLICGTETFIPDIDRNWGLVKQYPHVIGDFCWTGWDYLGEPSTGLVKYEAPPAELGMGCPYPALLSQVGEFSVSGNRRTCSYYHEIVLGRRKAPYIAVFRPEKYGVEPIITPWSWSDTVGSWSWAGFEGKPVKVEVYSDSEEVELRLNGQAVGRKRLTTDDRLKASFELPYAPGTLEAVSYSGGQETGRQRLVSATGKERLSAVPEKASVAVGEFIYIPLEAVGENGELAVQNREKVLLSLEGPAEFIGFLTDDPIPEENLCDRARTLYDGRALLALRATGSGTVIVKLTPGKMEETQIEITVC